ncbi:fumarylacetoacetate hydrolase family protein [Phreatobacter sp. AB_2022a]|uniref:fumarylacetoacetate hydrolase family protein n=1 Tax=Phreatobacter sp. AB_2022a TaxID=3003134 RepID=UPI00228763DE|nr:fumarylacetoacetate hydrolase family protein [Phreatobacter sp. AB_2022a]MCZ0732975.1 fumarylacetoacetate hydrolase family protein [Phreatobacter sp. AB_2022a]
MTDTAAIRYLFPPAPPVAIPVDGDGRLLPVGRIFCVGRNYADHAREMGVEVDREAPFYFTKPADAIVRSEAAIPYPPGTADYHYEMEFVVAIGTPVHAVPPTRALDAVFGYATGLDMTRRDLQLEARAKGRPWDLGKAFEQSAVIGPVTRREAFGAIGGQTIRLTVNGAVRQEARLSDLVWSVPELVSHLSRFYHLAPGDLIYTGTPAGVGAVAAGDRLDGTIDGLAPVRLTITP